MNRGRAQKQKTRRTDVQQNTRAHRCRALETRIPDPRRAEAEQQRSSYTAGDGGGGGGWCAEVVEESVEG
jgi:hypothetical protein